jgi:RNA polymerase sigma-70 factor (ECF subfamily)
MAEQPRSELELSRLVDVELVRAAQEGSASALRLIVRRHNQRLYRVARAIVRDDTEAEDVLQEAYLSAFRSLADFRAEASLSTWLTRIVANKAISRLQREDTAVPLDALDTIDWIQAEMVACLISILIRKRPRPGVKFASCWSGRSTICPRLFGLCS